MGLKHVRMVRCRCQGYLPEGTRYEDIVRVFGGPQIGMSPDGKTKAEWVGRINGLVFTIYDYKSRLDPSATPIGISVGSRSLSRSW